MRLRDQITLTHAAGGQSIVPAAVYYVDTANVDPDPGIDVPDRLVSVVRAIVRTLPEQFDVLTDTLTWRGRVFYLDGAPMPRMRGARVHHYTLNLTTEDPTP